EGAALLGSSVASWLYRALVFEPPAPRVCGTPGGPPVTAPRVALRDGRHLAYCESGVPRDEARVKVVFSHGFTGSRLDGLRASERTRIARCITAGPSDSTANCVRELYTFIHASLVASAA
ncbi:hypothetical protein EJB05_23696, partial [Eragrostis curvula]